MKATVKSSADGLFVQRTLDRKTLWEIHTPQIIRPEVDTAATCLVGRRAWPRQRARVVTIGPRDILRAGFRQCNEQNLEVTDDVSVVEQVSGPVHRTRLALRRHTITAPHEPRLENCAHPMP
eukprot:scaffold9162_cov108-Isochrysis_galbana.AAC.3